METTRSFFMTGCAGGIGKHLCSLLAAQGQQVYATDVNIEALEAAAKEGKWPSDRVILDRHDVRSYEEWESVFAKAVKTFDKIDVCMNIAGILKANWVQETPISEVHSQIDVNVKGVMFGTIVASKHMVERRQGHIMNIASMAGMAPLPGMSVYSGSKYAVRGFSMSAAAELKKHNVYVTVLCPDGVDTPLLHLPKENDAGYIIWSGTRLLTVEEIGRTVMDHILPNRPIVVSLPMYRALLSRFSDLFPGAASIMIPWLLRIGKQHREKQYGFRS